MLLSLMPDSPMAVIPYSTVYFTHPWSGFPSSICSTTRRVPRQTIRLKALADTFPAPSVLVPTLFQLLWRWRYRPWKKNVPGGV